MNRTSHLLFAAISASVLTVSAGQSETFHPVDAQAFVARYQADQAEFARKEAEFKAAEKAYFQKLNEAKKAKKEFNDPKPKRDFSAPVSFVIYPEAEKRADAKWNAENHDLKERQQAWDKADKATRSKWRPSATQRKVEPLEGEECGIRSTGYHRESMYNRVIFHPVEFSCQVANTGRHTVWIKYWAEEGSYAQMQLRVCNRDGETVRFQVLNRAPDLLVSPSRQGRKILSDVKKGWNWVKTEVDFEYAGDFRFILSAFDRNVHNGSVLNGSRFAIKDVWVSDDPAFDPDRSPAVAQADSPNGQTVPEGFQAARHHPVHARLNTAIMDSQKRLLTNFMESYGWYGDLPGLISLGGVDLYSSGGRADALKYGFTFQQGVASGLPKLKKGEKREPIDPAKLVKGEGWWSDSFREKYTRCLETAEKSVRSTMAEEGDDLLACWWTAWEQCGGYDYGKESVADYRVFLNWKHGSLENLNAAWHTDYKSFDEIVPSKWDNFYGKHAFTNELERHQAMANFVDFRDFRSKVYATEIGIKTDAIMRNDNRGPGGRARHVSSNLSANNIASVMWMRWRPLCFEDTAQITMKGSDMIGYDNYGTDDVMGSFYEIFDCFGDGRLRPMVREGSTHAPQPEVYARTVWGNVAKGMRGMDTFVWHESGNGARQGELQKFGLSNMWDDGAPRPKLAAASDAYRAMHQLDHLLSETKRERAVKPVAIYYSSICNLLQENPYASIFDPGPDNFFRVYELMHANGYPVTFVTDRQIREGGEWLKGLKAIVFIDATYIPRDVQQKVREWVEAGGHIFADAQSGSCDGYTFPTPDFTEWLGIRPVQQKKVDANAAANLSFGYSAYSFDVIQRDALFKTSCEVKDAHGGEHPINRLLGKAMISAMGYNEIKCVEGAVILQENNSRPYMTVREHGKGSSTYFAGYAGTMFGAGCTQYEWRDKHSDNSPYRIMDAWLTWIGAEKLEVNDLPRDIQYSLRFESPLVDARGNAFMGMVSQLPCDCESFRVKYRMPAGFKAPKMCLVSGNSSRRLMRVPYSFDERTREFSARMPAFSVWQNLIALNDCEPLVSVEFEPDTKRDAYGLADVRPGDELVAHVTVFNPGAKTLSGAELQLRLPEGWFYDKETAKVADIPAYGESAEYVFRIKAPSVNCARRLKPINFVLNHPSLPNGSGPAVEMVWFQKEPQLRPGAAFGVE